MAIKLASLFVKLGADSAELNKEFKKSKKSANTWKRDMDKIGKAAGTSLRNVTVAAGAATAGLTALYTINAQALDVLGKNAAKLGETASGMNTVGLAANYGGVEVGTMTSALAKMTDIVSNAANGLGTAGASINELGLDIEALNRLSPSQQFEAISAALEKIPDHNDRIRLSMDFYGKSGADLLNVTSAAIERARERTEALDKAFGVIDTTAIEAANDSMTDVSSLFDRAGQSFTQQMAPAVKIVADEIFNAATQGQQFDKVIGSFIDGAIGGAINIVEFVNEALSFIDSRPGLVEGGIVGYMLFGKKGAVAAAVLAALGIESYKFYNETRTLLSDSAGELEKVEVRIAKVQKLIDSGLAGAGGRFVGDRTKYLETLQNQLTTLIDQRDVLLSGQPEGGTEEKFLGTAETEAGFLLGTLYKIRDERASLILGDASLTPSLSPTGGTATGGSTDAGSVEEDGFLTSEQIRFTAIEEAQAQHLSNLKAANEAAKANEILFQQEHGRHLDAILQGDAQGKLKGVKAYFGAELDQFSKHSRGVFELNKALNIGNVIGNTAAGITKAFSLPFPKSLLVAGKYALSGAAQLAAIHRSKFNSGGSAPSAPSGTADAGSVSSAPSADIDEEATEAATQQASTTYNLYGMFAKKDADEIVADSFKTLAEDGYVTDADGREIDTRNIIGSAA